MSHEFTEAVSRTTIRGFDMTAFLQHLQCETASSIVPLSDFLEAFDNLGVVAFREQVLGSFVEANDRYT